MQEKLVKGMKEKHMQGEGKFQHVVLVDDFTGSGYTLIREGNGGFDGKLIKVRNRLDDCRTKGSIAPYAKVSILMYIASKAAEQSVQELVARAGLNWPLTVVQSIPHSCRVTDPAMEALAKDYYDEVLNDAHKGNATFGFRDSRLPLVLSHNTPNNSIALLWGDTSERPGSLSRYALFTRYERHSADRP